MSKLNDLINEFCPNGVEYKPLGSLIKREREKGKHCPNITQVYTISNTLGVVRSEDFHERVMHSEKTGNYTVLRHGMFAYNPSRLNVGSISFLKSNIDGLVSPMYVVFSVDNKINSDFLGHFLKSSYVLNKINILKEEGARFRFDFKRWNYIEIPIPPLPVQKEIVRILDKFTDRTTRLVELLNKELTARKKQYGYYRDFLLSEEQLGDEVKWVKLGDVCDVRDGTHASPKKTLSGKLLITSKNVKKSTIDFSGAYFISDKDYQQINERSKVDVWDVLFTMIGTIGEIALVTSPPNYAIKNMGLIKTNDELLSRFLRHYLASEKARNYIKKNKSKGSQEFLALGKLREFPVPVISKNKMSSVVKILDKFDSLVNDLSKGLPAEIEARKKQYEYYRDKLLSFKQTEE